MALKIARVTDRKTSEHYETLGIQEFAAGNWDAAAAHLLAALELDEANASLYLKLGTVLLQQGFADKALIAIKRCLELSPYDADAFNAMGVVLFHHEFWGAAEQFFRKAIQLDPAHATAKTALVEALRRKREGGPELPEEFGTVLALLDIQEPKLSLCMIAKNEEVFIGDCLASVRGLVDEIIVVDTGSTDRTIEIAESYGAKVFHLPWQGDFATARNASLSHATGDWILVLDADEMIPAEGHAELRKALRGTENVGYGLVIENLLGEAGTESQLALIFRLFRNRPDIRYEGIIHEQAMISAQRTGLPIQNLQTRIVHRGYLDRHVADRDKYQRNLDILLRQVEEESENPYVHFNLGQTYKLLGRNDESERSYLLCLRMLDEQNLPLSTPYWVTAYFSLADLYRLTGEINKGLQIVDEGLRRFPDAPDIRFNKALLLVAANRHREAIEEFQACRAYKGRVYASGNDPAVPTYKSSQGMGVAYSRLGEHAAAKQHYLQALKEWPNPNAELFMNLGIVHFDLGELPGALSYFIKAVELDERSAKAWGNIGHVCQKLGQMDESLTARRKAYELDPREHGLIYGMSLIDARNFPEAVRVLTEQTALSPALASPWIYLGLAQLCLGMREEAMRLWTELANRPGLEPTSLQEVSSFLRFVQLLEADSPSVDAVQLLERDGELWVTLLAHLIHAERYSEVEQALRVFGALSDSGFDLSLGRMLAQNGLHDEALGFLLKAREHSPESPEIYVLIGEAAEATGRGEDAQIMYQMALSIDPRQPHVRQRLGRLRLSETRK